MEIGYKKAAYKKSPAKTVFSMTQIGICIYFLGRRVQE